MLHQNDNRDSIKDCGSTFHQHSSMCLSHPDKTLKHSDRLSVLVNLRVHPKVLVIIANQLLCFLSHIWLEYTLNKVYIVSQHIYGPELLLYRLNKLSNTAAIEDKVCFQQIVFNIMLIQHYKDEVKPTEET
jgi:hypothetical protein